MEGGETAMNVELNDDQNARLESVAEERGLTAGEAARLILVSGINSRYRELRFVELGVVYAERLAKGEINNDS